MRTDDIASNEGPDEGRKCHKTTEGDHGKTGLTQRKRNARIPRRRFSGIYRLPVFELTIRGFLKKGLTRKLYKERKRKVVDTPPQGKKRGGYRKRAKPGKKAIMQGAHENIIMVY